MILKALKADAQDTERPGGNASSGSFVLGLRTGFRLCADCVNGLVNAMIQGRVVSICRSPDEVLDVLGMLPNGTGKA